MRIMRSPLASILYPSLRAFQVFGANTEVGKTVFTTLLSRTAKRLGADSETVAVLKPVSTGPGDEADERHFERFAPSVAFRTLFQYDLPVSPHLAAQVSSKAIPSDLDILHQCRDHAASIADRDRGRDRERASWLFLETAGGVHSPGPSGTTQADLYAPLRLPVILIGDSRLGGISQTISAFESLRIRGYDVQSVLLFDEARYQNYPYLARYFPENHGVPVWGLEQPPQRHASSSPADDITAMHRYYEGQSRKPIAAEILSRLDIAHQARIKRLGSMAQKAHDVIWYPFTQQKLVAPEDITVIDSASGDYFQTLYNASSDSDSSLLRASFDGSASWWTQGLGHANPKLTLAAAHAAGRYGHVMFASAVHEPALALAETLLDGMNNPRLSRVFYSDNGSTGVEVAIKMGLRAARLRYMDDRDGNGDRKLGILGLKGSYHGDTMGAMDCAEPSCFNEKIEWYDGKGYWFDYPTVMCVDGRWRVQVPDSLMEDLGRGGEFASLSNIFDLEARERDGGHSVYEAFIAKTLERLQAQGHRFGALMMEPVVLGAGGMALVDPLFQRALVNVVRRSPDLFFRRPNTQQTEAAPNNDGDGREWAGLPVIFDEVFTGLYRLGRFSASSLLGVDADISVHAKLLTGGLVPLCVTMASEDIFRVFSSDDKTDALLHGHSYTAHPVGCQVALESVREMQKMDQRGDWNWAKHQDSSLSPHSYVARDVPLVWSVWPRSFVERLTRKTERVAGAWALGSVLAIHMRDAAGSGYCSNAAQDLRDLLMRGDAEISGSSSWNIHCRVLGHVLYIMAGQTTASADVKRITSRVESALL